MSRELKRIGHYVRRYWAGYVLGILALMLVDVLIVFIPQIAVFLPNAMGL